MIKHKLFLPISIFILFIFTGVCTFLFNKYCFNGIWRNSGAYWQEKIWLLGEINENDYQLISFSPDSKKQSIIEIEINAPFQKDGKGIIRLLSGSDRLWIVSRYCVGYYKDNKFHYEKTSDLEYDITDYFLYMNRPAVVGEDEHDDIYLLSFMHGSWQKIQQIPFDKNKISKNLPIKASIGAFSVNDELFLFYRKKHLDSYKVYFCNIKSKQWSLIPIEGSFNEEVSLDGKLAVFSTNISALSRVKAVKLEEGQWKQFYSSDKRFLFEDGAAAIYPLNHGDDFVMLRQSLIGHIHVFTVINGKEEHRFRIFGFLSLLRFLQVLFVPIFLIVSCGLLYWISKKK